MATRAARMLRTLLTVTVSAGLVAGTAVQASAAPAADTVAPTGSFILSPVAVWPGQSVKLTQSAVADDESPESAITRTIRWSDGSTEDLPYWQPSTTRTFTRPGRYTASMSLTDAAGNVGQATPVGAATVVVTVPGRFVVSPRSTYPGLKVNLGLYGVPAGTGRVIVNWGDGRKTAVKPTAKATSTIYPAAGTFTVTVTLTNRNGSSTVTAARVIVKRDAWAPTISLIKPKNATKATSWKTIKGKVSDRGSGVAGVGVVLVEKRGSKWYYYSKSKKWVKATSLSAAFKKAALHFAKVTRTTWKVSVKGVAPGQLYVIYVAVDNSGGSKGKYLTQRITRK